MLNTIIGIDVEGDMSHVDIFLALVHRTTSGVRRGLHNSQGELFVSVVGRGAFAFDITREKHSTYWAEKLNVSVIEAQAIILEVCSINPELLTLKK